MVISIDAHSTQKTRVGGGSRKIPDSELRALMEASLQLLDHLGKIADNIEVIKISSWYGSHLNIFDVKVVVCVIGEEVKAEANEVFEECHHQLQKRDVWKSERLTLRIVEDMTRATHRAIRNRISGLGVRIERWEKLLHD